MRYAVELTLTEKILKLIRFIKIYGFSRAFSKLMGRLNRIAPFLGKIYFSHDRHIGIIGCGQFAFATLAFFLGKKKKNFLLTVFDVDKQNAQGLSSFYRVSHVSDTVDQLFKRDGLRLVYVTSNHSTHSEYAIKAIKHGLAVYIEKPAAVNFTQYHQLFGLIKRKSPDVYFGYNRPFSKAIRHLRQFFDNEVKEQPFSVSCFISGHKIPDDHWYKNAHEGSRICGNLGHWIDLVIHFFFWRINKPSVYRLKINYSDSKDPTDNIAISLATDMGDIINFMLTSRTEPFEGVTENINFQYSDIICRIDDFRSMTVWRRSKRKKIRFWPKDVGHERAILQPFHQERRQVEEVEVSTALMLHIAEMVSHRKEQKVLKAKDLYAK